jgi:CheY-like chemotaxis protein
VSVETGEEALSRAVGLQPVLILMDLRLPGIDGLETTQILKHNPLTKDIPVWAITAYAMKGDEERARAAGCCEYITKPVRAVDLANRLHAFFGQLEQQEART